MPYPLKSDDKFPHNHVFGTWEGPKFMLPAYVGQIAAHVLDRYEERFGFQPLDRIAQDARVALAHGKLQGAPTLIWDAALKKAVAWNVEYDEKIFVFRTKLHHGQYPDRYATLRTVLPLDYNNTLAGLVKDI